LPAQLYWALACSALALPVVRPSLGVQREARPSGEPGVGCNQPQQGQGEMANKIIIAVAPVGPVDLWGVRNPLTPEQIADDVVACAGAGASLVHLHVRDESGNFTKDLGAFRRTLDIIRENSDIVIQVSTGSLSDVGLEERCAALEDARVEMATLNMGSVDRGDSAYKNSTRDIRYWAGRMKQAAVRPELGIFEVAMLHTVRVLSEEGYLEPPHVYGFRLGYRGGPWASPENLYFLRSSLPENATWGLVHYHMMDMSLLMAAAAMGASMLRVGFEDSIYQTLGGVATANAELVKRLGVLLDRMGLQVATPTEAREILGVIKPYQGPNQPAACPEAT